MPNGERMNGIRAFVQAEASGSFAAAGVELGLSQSAVGKTIARLEERLGARLFNRTTRHLSLTDEGRAYHQGCLRALAELEAAEKAVADRRQSPSGRLRLNLPDLFGRRWIVPVLTELAARHADLFLDISFDNRFVDLAEEGFDLVVRIGKLADHAGLIARQLGTQKLVTCAAPAYLATHGTPGSPDALPMHGCITQLRHGREDPWLFLDATHAIHRMPIQGRHRFTKLDAVADAALAGLGLAQLPAWLIADRLWDGQLITIFPEAASPELPIHALWLQTRAMVPRIRATVDALVGHFQHGSEWRAVQTRLPDAANEPKETPPEATLRRG